MTPARLTAAERATARPLLTVTEAAAATGKSRRTIARLLDADRLEGAHRDDAGAWRIPADALLAAGLQLHAPTPTDPPTLPAPPVGTPTDTEAALRAELADWRRRAEVAEAVAAERATALEDVRTALRMLTAGPTTDTPRRRWRKQPR